MTTPRCASALASEATKSNPRAAASTTTKLSPPKAVSTVTFPMLGTSSSTDVSPAKEGRFRIVILSVFPSRHSAITFTNPPGASSVISVKGSIIGIIPVSKSTVATQIALEPDMGGVSSGSIIIQPMCASECIGGTSKFTCLNTPPRGSLSIKFRKVLFLAIQVLCSHKVFPGGGATPPTITSPTSPSA